MKNKWRNLWLALLCLAVFVGGGVVFYQHWVQQRVFGIVLFLVPQLDSSTLSSARFYAGGANHRLHLEQMPGVFFLRGSSHSHAAPDEAAAASAIATGHAVNNGTLAVLPDGVTPLNLLQLARQNGRAIGLVTNGRIANPALGAFYAPGENAENFEQLLATLLETTRPEVVLGGGLHDFTPDLHGGRRQDGRDLLLQARQSGYDIVRNQAELLNTPTWRAPRVLGVFHEDALTFAGTFDAATGEPDLSTMVSSAIRLLQFQNRGFFLIVDCRQLARAAAFSQGEQLLREFLEVDRAIQTASLYAGENSLVVVAGTVSLGGFRLNGHALREDHGMALLSPSSDGVPGSTWSTGPGRTNPPEPSAIPEANALPIITDLLGFWQGPPRATAPPLWLKQTDVFSLLEQEM
jgi:alkaline phosphatase